MATSPRRSAAIIRLRPGAAEEYERMHRQVLPELLEALSRAGIRNYTIYRHGDLLFAYREYVGDDQDRDLRALDAEPVSQRWNAMMRRLQRSVDPAPAGTWLELDEVFRLE